jgi:D-alanyl-D-alanine endopeptidase (penicillin-binding protein 7)
MGPSLKSTTVVADSTDGSAGHPAALKEGVFMPLRHVARHGLMLVIALALLGDLPAPPMLAAAPVTPEVPGIEVAAKSKRSAGKRVRRRSRARRPPPGGVYARQAFMLDPTTGRVLFEKNADTPVPIASLTQLMTAIVFIGSDPELSRPVEVTRAELSGGGKTQLRNHEMVKLGDLLHMSLMCSDNVATRVLARESGVSREEFLSRMNRKALELGLTHTRFVEFTGLDERNVSTAADVAKLLQTASDQPLIRQICTTRSYEFRSKTRPHFIGNTNRLLYGRYEVLGGKTGFISEAGYCFATWVRTQGRDMIAVVLGAPTNATRFADVVRMVQSTIAKG